MNPKAFHEDAYLGPPGKLDEGVLRQVWDARGDGEIAHVKGGEYEVRRIGGRPSIKVTLINGLPAPEMAAYHGLGVQWEDCPVGEDSGVESHVGNQTLEKGSTEP